MRFVTVLMLEVLVSSVGGVCKGDDVNFIVFIAKLEMLNFREGFKSTPQLGFGGF